MGLNRRGSLVLWQALIADLRPAVTTIVAVASIHVLHRHRRHQLKSHRPHGHGFVLIGRDLQLTPVTVVARPPRSLPQHLLGVSVVSDAPWLNTVRSASAICLSSTPERSSSSSLLSSAHLCSSLLMGSSFGLCSSFSFRSSFGLRSLFS